MHGTQEKCIEGFVTKTPREGEHLEDLGVDGRIVSKWIFPGGEAKIDLAQYRERWRALVCAAKYFRVPQNTRILLTI